MSTTRGILIAARALIATRENWTQDTYARTALGDTCPVLDCRAVCFCAAGAILRASGQSTVLGEQICPALDALRGAMVAGQSGMQIDEFNDAPSTTHRAVLAAFDEAIEACQ